MTKKLPIVIHPREKNTCFGVKWSIPEWYSDTMYGFETFKEAFVFAYERLDIGRCRCEIVEAREVDVFIGGCHSKTITEVLIAQASEEAVKIESACILYNGSLSEAYERVVGCRPPEKEPVKPEYFCEAIPSSKLAAAYDESSYKVKMAISALLNTNYSIAALNMVVDGKLEVLNCEPTNEVNP